MFLRIVLLSSIVSSAAGAKDIDKDGIPDKADFCPEVAGPEPEGCPPGPPAPPDAGSCEGTLFQLGVNGDDTRLVFQCDQYDLATFFSHATRDLPAELVRTRATLTWGQPSGTVRPPGQPLFWSKLVDAQGREFPFRLMDALGDEAGKNATP